MVDYSRINNTLGKMGYYLATHECICVGVSGGSDSNVIVHMIATHFREYLPKVHFVFINTGLEYAATKKHIKYMEERYGITIDRIRGESIVSACHRYGVPILSKEFSQVVERAKTGAESSIKKINGDLIGKDGRKSRYNFTPKQKALANYLLENNVEVSAKCCTVSKKQPVYKYYKKMGCDLVVTGERQCEGGLRAGAHSSCFEKAKSHDQDKYMPLFFWDDETKQWYKEHEQIKYSDCYEVWGMKRTGCVGCPFNSRVGQDLSMLKQHEPNLYKACMHVFGESYRLMDQFHVHRHQIFDDEEQIGMDFED